MGQVSEELTRLTRFRPPDPIVDGPESMETVKPYTSVRCAKEAKEVSFNLGLGYLRGFECVNHLVIFMS